MPSPIIDIGLGLAASTLTVGAWAYAAMTPASQLFGQTLIAGKNPNEAALTFDDGPNGDTTLRLLDILGRHNAHATFFLIGNFVRQQPDIVRAIAAAGHLIGNHTMTHPWLHIQGAARIHEELSGCNRLLEDTLGTPIHFFRPPHGARRPIVLKICRELGMTPVQWNVMAFDWKPQTSQHLTGRIEHAVAGNRGRKTASNILLHDGGHLSLDQPRMPSVEAADRLLTGFAELRIRPVTVDAWL